jgi:hypothetical protein
MYLEHGSGSRFTLHQDPHLQKMNADPQYFPINVIYLGA